MRAQLALVALGLALAALTAPATAAPSADSASDADLLSAAASTTASHHLDTPATTPFPVGGPSCGSIANEVFADMHDGDQKNVTLTEAGLLTLSQAATAAQPVAWTLTTRIDLTTCVASIDFSKSKKPARPPVPLNARILQSTVGTLLLEFTDPSGTLNPDPKVRRPVIVIEVLIVIVILPCPRFPPTPYTRILPYLLPSAAIPYAYATIIVNVCHTRCSYDALCPRWACEHEQHSAPR